MKFSLAGNTIRTTGIAIICMAFYTSCSNEHEETKAVAVKPDTLTEEQKHLPENALKGLTIANGLAVTPFAVEPMLQNPTNIDVDERGRVWVTEAYNYRPAINGNPTNALGDRIMILEDTNGDGYADTAKVFYQGPELNAPLGICVLGNRVIISQSPFVWSFYDDDGDDRADRKEILFQGIGGEQHDHGAHAFSFGVDGKLYFNFGNEAKTIRDKNGKAVIDQDGEVIGPKKYQQGMAFRCNPDGSQVEVLGDNFRNPYEIAVDSYGALWQSDNDDDGNKGTRINFVMPYGNYGYTDEMTGAYWQSGRTNMEDSIPFRHWHLNDPGEVPNLLQTGAGSPTGMLVYEGDLLPQVFRNQLIHSDAGPNVVRSYPVKQEGAGYTAQIENILKGDNDPWFRPADVATAPDGSLIIADWYDPGVGGHAAGDQVRGRIYRVAPVGVKYTQPKFDYTTPDGAILALFNPNLSIRYHAFTSLVQMGKTAIPALEKSWKENKHPRMRARAFWVLVKIAGSPVQQYLTEAIHDENADLRCMAIRAAVELKQLDFVLPFVLSDKAIAVRREAALSLYHQSFPLTADWWTTLALQYDGKDRWYLEALGIGADRQWDRFFPVYLNKVKDPLASAAGRDIVWRARTPQTLPYLAALAVDASIPIKERQRYFRAFDFNPYKSKNALLLSIIKNNSANDQVLNKLALQTLDAVSVKQSPIAQKALASVLDSVIDTREFLDLVAKYSVKNKQKELLTMAIAHSGDDLGQDAMALLLTYGGKELVWNEITDNISDTTKIYPLITTLGEAGTTGSVDILQSILLSAKYTEPMRLHAASAIGESGAGEGRVLKLLKQHKVPDTLKAAVVASISDSWLKSVRDEAASYLPSSSVVNAASKAPAMADIKSVTPDAAKGQVIFASTCSLCHVAGGKGYDFGPALSEIGSKLPKESLLESIVHPSAGIGFGYEGWSFALKDGSSFQGILASKTATEMEVKFPGGGRKKIKTAEIANMTAMKTSMMTEGLYERLTVQDLANLLEYLSSLKKK